jgi:alpha-L-fucosidase 2
VPHRNGKWLVTSPSGSPENGFVLVNGRALRHGDPKPANGERNSIAQGVAMDTQLLRDVFRQVSTAAEQLGVDPELRAEIARALPRLPPDQIRADGTLQEWLEPYLEYDPKHRHVSHLYAAYPSNQITRRGPPDLVEAVRKTLVIRNDPAGWTGAWKINLHARLGQAEEAYRVLHRMQTDISKHPAPEDSDRVPSLEGNQAIQGFTAGVAELLLQSHVPLPGTTTRFELELLPALPRAWATGSVRGLRARGGWEVDLAWRDGRLANATLRATHAGPVRLRTGEAVALQRDGRPVATRPIEAGCVEFAAEAGAVYTITGGGRR